MDAGRFLQAYTVLEFEAEEGSQIETEHAQRCYQTGRKPSESYGRVNQYAARAKAQTYMSGDTFGFKCLVIRVTSGRVRLLGVRGATAFILSRSRADSSPTTTCSTGFGNTA
jgi:hypothetical protein